MHYPVSGLPDSHQSKQTRNIILYVLQEGKRGLYPHKGWQILFSQLQYHRMGMKAILNTEQLAWPAVRNIIICNISPAQCLPKQEAADRKKQL